MAVHLFYSRKYVATEHTTLVERTIPNHSQALRLHDLVIPLGIDELRRMVLLPNDKLPLKSYSCGSSCTDVWRVNRLDSSLHIVITLSVYLNPEN